MANTELGPGSEGDAYRYTKKVLQGLPNAADIRRIYSEVARNRGVSSWTRACYQELRTQFFRDGQCKIKFAPGVARIAFGELDMGTGDEDFRQLADLRDYVRIISIAHFTEYTRHLAINGKELNFAELTETYGSTAKENWMELRKELESIDYGPRRYTVIWLDSFDTARQYYKYTQPHGWCHLNSASMFQHYSFSRCTGFDGKASVMPVKLYLAVLPGYEDMTEDDPLYGESMLGIDVGPGGRLIHVNNRWNHDHDNIDERKGDNKYSERELSELMGAPYYRLCPPMTKTCFRKVESRIGAKIRRRNSYVRECSRDLAAQVLRAVRGKASGTGTFTDSRDGITYPTMRCGSLEWFTAPLKKVSCKEIDSARIVEIKTAVEALRNMEAYPPTATAYDDPETESSCDGTPYDNYCDIILLHGKPYLGSELSIRQAETGTGVKIAKYERDCEEYAEWRRARIEEEERDIPVEPFDEHDEPFLDSPLGFTPYIIEPGMTGSRDRNRVQVDLGSDTVMYGSSVNLSEVIPDGWRLPTLAEFIAMALRNGGQADFCDFEYLRSMFFPTMNNEGHDNEVNASMEGGVSRTELRERLYEGFIFGNIGRKYGTVHEPGNTGRLTSPGEANAAPDEHDDPTIDYTQNDINEAVQNNAFKLPAALGLRMPRVKLPTGFAPFGGGIAGQNFTMALSLERNKWNLMDRASDSSHFVDIQHIYGVNWNYDANGNDILTETFANEGIPVEYGIIDCEILDDGKTYRLRRQTTLGGKKVLFLVRDIK